MKLNSIIDEYQSTYFNKYQSSIQPNQSAAIRSIQRCRTSQSGELFLQCSKCDEKHWQPLSCGNRNCPVCQNHESSQWLDRQQKKLLPVEYFMVTFTLPYQLRKLVWLNQQKIYTLFFECISSTLKDFGLNPDNKLDAEIGMTAVLHTHSRKLDYHPHIHVIVPGGGINKQKKQWRKIKGKYLFNEFALSRVFRARFLTALNQNSLVIPSKLPQKWIVDCTHVGKGFPALKYLSRYLYRGVISEKNIISNKNGMVTFQYTDSKTKQIKHRILKGEDFLNLIFLHVLPKGFRRVRDYGFLHPNAKKILFLVQLVLHVIIKEIKLRPRPSFKCNKCQSTMNIVAFLKYRHPD